MERSIARCGEIGKLIKRTTMAQSSSTNIARKARSKAEADFATWLMMAKLGSYDDLPAIAQAVLTNFQSRLEKMSDTDSKALAIREIYAAYYSEMGGTGTAPEPEPRPKNMEDNVVRFERARDVKVAATAAAARGGKPKTARPIPALLIFAAMVVAIAAFKFLVN
jgi:hypothetical protein